MKEFNIVDAVQYGVVDPYRPEAVAELATSKMIVVKQPYPYHFQFPGTADYIMINSKGQTRAGEVKVAYPENQEEEDMACRLRKAKEALAALLNYENHYRIVREGAGDDEDWVEDVEDKTADLPVPVLLHVRARHVGHSVVPLTATASTLATTIQSFAKGVTAVNPDATVHVEVRVTGRDVSQQLAQLLADDALPKD